MNATLKALRMIGMTLDDMEREDFFRRSGRKAAFVLRSMGYTRERFPTYAGNAVTRWAAPAVAGEYRPPVVLDDCPAFRVLVVAISETEANR
jgi:hypothetical protein